MKKEYKLNLLKIKFNYNIHINEKMQELNDSNLNYFEKKILLLKLEESTTIFLMKNSNLTIIERQYENDEENNNVINYYNNTSLYNSNFVPYLSYNISLTETTLYETKLGKDINNSIIENIQELKFNPLRANFCLKHNLYDIPLVPEINNFNHPPKYKINDELFAFLYPNILKTYCITITGFIANNRTLIYNSKNLELKDYNSQYNILLGLYFCGKEEKIKIGNKTEYKICKPNEFICKQCMNLNKQKYNLKNNYLININGRVSKINKGIYHCFGNFLVENQIEQCINKFCCDGCKNLNYYYDYYI